MFILRIYCSAFTLGSSGKFPRNISENPYFSFVDRTHDHTKPLRIRTFLWMACTVTVAVSRIFFFYFKAFSLCLFKILESAVFFLHVQPQIESKDSSNVCPHYAG